MMKTMRLTAALAACGLVLLTGNAAANSIAVANVGLQGQNTNGRTMNVVFDLAWDNSWRGADNWDAAWVFVKFRAPGSTDWEHAILSANAADHSASAGTIAAGLNGRQGDWGTTGLGVFVYSSANRTGSVSYAGTKLRWNYGSNGYNFALGAVVEVSVHAIEMVYIPQGAFYLGSGGGEVGRFYRYTDGTQTTQPYLVLSETNAILVGATNGNLYYPSAANVGDQSGPISNAFPKGYAAFYCMKYEVSQGEYADFLNKLTATQDAARFLDQNGNYRNTIGGTTTNRTASAPDRACNYLSWADGIAYADWAALRPMTELEYEKACRGAAYPVTNEYAWGSTSNPRITNEYVTAGSGTETPQPTNANCCWNGNLGGPTRVGIFANTDATRESSGAGYYGVMELSGNVWERPVTVGTNMGRAFMGTHGDGVLAADGNATNNADWPGTDAIGSGYRGGDWDIAATALRLSDRGAAARLRADRIYASYIGGWRAVRGTP